MIIMANSYSQALFHCILRAISYHEQTRDSGRLYMQLWQDGYLKTGILALKSVLLAFQRKDITV